MMNRPGAAKEIEHRAVTPGGMAYDREYDVGRFPRESHIARIAPPSPRMIMNLVAEGVPGLPRAY